MKILNKLFTLAVLEKSKVYRTILVFSSFALIGNVSAQQNAVSVDSKIASVILYPGSAMIERSFKVTVGVKKITFNCLPGNLDTQSLSVSADAAVRVGEFSVLTETSDNVKSCANTALASKITELEDKKASLTVESEAIVFVTNYLKTIGNKEGERSDNRIANDPKSIAMTADILRKTAQESLSRTNDINRQQEALNVLLKPLLAERNRIQSNRNSVKNVTVAISASRDSEIKLKYQINGPSWIPTYRAMLDSTTGNLQLERQAIVAQSTGEDWSDVQLKLSTGQPQRRLSEPAYTQWNIGIATPPQVKSISQDQRNYMAAPAPAAAAAPLARSAEAGQESSFDVSVFNNSFNTEFAVPQSISVPSNGQRVTLALGSIESKVKIFARSHPSLEASAFMIAELSQPEGIWPSGSLQLYRDGAYVGKDTLTVGGKLPLNLSFGHDELITVSLTPQKDFRSTAGFTGSREQRNINRAFSVENRHRKAISLQIIEVSPISTDEQVKIEAQFTPKPDTTTWNERQGAVLWKTELEAGKTTRFTADYTINFPKDARLQESR
jgi:uncharacterized protein (TIGR02231 family)